MTRGTLISDMGDNLPTVPLGDFNATAVYSGNEFSCAVDDGGAIKVRSTISKIILRINSNACF